MDGCSLSPFDVDLHDLLTGGSLSSGSPNDPSCLIVTIELVPVFVQCYDVASGTPGLPAVPPSPFAARPAGTWPIHRTPVQRWHKRTAGIPPCSFPNQL